MLLFALDVAPNSEMNTSIPCISIFHVHEIRFHYLVQAVGIIGDVAIIWTPAFRESFQCMNRLFCEPGRFIKDFLLNQQWSDTAG